MGTCKMCAMGTAYCHDMKLTPVIVLAGSLLIGLVYCFTYREMKLLAH